MTAEKALRGHVLGFPLTILISDLSTVDEVARRRLEEAVEKLAQVLVPALQDHPSAEKWGKSEAMGAARALVAYHQGVMLMARCANDPEIALGLMEPALHLLDLRPVTSLP